MMNVLTSVLAGCILRRLPACDLASTELHAVGKRVLLAHRGGSHVRLASMQSVLLTSPFMVYRDRCASQHSLLGQK